MNKEITINFGRLNTKDDSKHKYHVELDVEITDRNGYDEFSVSGYVYGTNRNDMLLGGQCLDEIDKYFSEDLKHQGTYAFFSKIRYYWKKYHLSGLHAGTKDQEGYLRMYHPNLAFATDYDECCKVLKRAGLYEVELEKKNEYGIEVPKGKNTVKYKFGTNWLRWGIPKETFKEINLIIDKGINEKGNKANVDASKIADLFTNKL